MTFLYQQRPVGKWQVVVIFPKRSINTNVSPDFREYHGSGRLKIVYLDKLPQSLMQSYPLTLLQLVNAPSRKEVIVPLVQEVLSEMVQKEHEIARRDDLERLVSRIISVKLPQLSIEEIRIMVELLLSDFEKTRVYRDIVAIGKQEGISQGINQGISLGVRQGMRQQQEITATNLLAMGLSIADIAKATGLSGAEVCKLQKQAAQNQDHTMQQSRSRKKTRNS